MEQLGLEGMPTKLFACTPSRLTTWLDCPRRYRMTYVDRPAPPKGPPWAHNTVGAAVHLALARWWDLPLSRRTPEAARALVAQAWQPEGFADDAQADRWRGRAGEMAARYVEGLDPEDEPRGVERTVAFPSARLAVSGRVDRVDQRGDEVVVVDYKTGRSALTQDDARGSLALALYALACRRTFHTEDSLARHLGRAEAVAAEATAAAETGDYPARPSALCGWCDVARHCPEGLEASGGPRKPWAGLAQEEPVG